MARRSPPEAKIDTGRWLLTYSDLMNNLLVLFIMLYSMSVMDLTKFEQLVVSFAETFGTEQRIQALEGTGDFSIEDIDPDILDAMMAEHSPQPGEAGIVTPEPTPEPTPNASLDPEADEYDELVARISALLRENGYDEHITVEKSGDYIYLRFREGILFLPDQAVMREGAMPILANISEVILDSYDLISNIDISGHTARIPYDLPSKDNLFSWELSTNRALTGLEYLVRQCDMPQEKLSVTGYSSNLLYVQGNSEEYWAQNRRVEIRLSKAKSQPSAKTAPDKKSTSS